MKQTSHATRGNTEKTLALLRRQLKRSFVKYSYWRRLQAETEKDLIRQAEMGEREKAELYEELKAKTQEAAALMASREEFRRVNEEQYLLKKRLSALIEENAKVSSENSGLRNQFETLKQRTHDDGNLIRDLEGQVASLELASMGGTVTLDQNSPNLIRFQNDFTSFGEQEFEDAAKALFLHLKEQHPGLKLARKEETAKIKNLLLNIVFVEENERLDSEHNAKKAESAFQTLSEIALTPQAQRNLEYFRAQVENELQFERKQRAIQNNADAALGDTLEQRLHQIEECLFHHAILPAGERQQLKQLLQRGHDLLVGLRYLRPAGVLEIAAENDIYHPDKHQLSPGCVGETITLTLYPGYSVGSRVEVKPIVFTSIN